MISNPVVNDIDLYRGRDFEREYKLQDSEENTLDLTGWSFDAEIRPVYGSDNLLATFNTTSGTVLESGIVNVSLGWEVTKDLEVENPINIGSNTTSSNMVWDLMVTDNNDQVYSIVTGKVILHETATVKED